MNFSFFFLSNKEFFVVAIPNTSFSPPFLPLFLIKGVILFLLIILYKLVVFELFNFFIREN